MFDRRILRKRKQRAARGTQNSRHKFQVAFFSQQGRQNYQSPEVVSPQWQRCTASSDWLKASSELSSNCMAEAIESTVHQLSRFYTRVLLQCKIWYTRAQSQVFTVLHLCALFLVQSFVQDFCYQSQRLSYSINHMVHYYLRAFNSVSRNTKYILLSFEA